MNSTLEFAIDSNKSDLPPPRVDENGQGMVEYALIILLIAIVIIIVLTIMGTQLSTTFSRIAAGFP